MSKTYLGESAEIKQIFCAEYKVGPIQKSINFTSTNIENARREFSEFLEILRGSEFRKVIQIGHVKPFASDIKEEIDEIKRKTSTNNAVPAFSH